MIPAIKKCDDDDSVIVRLYDIEGKDTMADLQTDFSIKKAFQTNLIEEEAKHIPSKKNRLDISVGHHAIETYKLNIK